MRENQEQTRGKSDRLLDIKTGLFPPRLPNSCSFLDQISSPHFLRSPTRLGFVPNDPHQPTTKRRCFYALAGLSPGPHPHNHQGTTRTKSGSNPSRRFFGSFLAASYTSSCLPLISSSCVPFSFCSGVPLQKRKTGDQPRSTTHTGLRTFFSLLPRSFTTAPGTQRQLPLSRTFLLSLLNQATRTFSAQRILSLFAQSVICSECLPERLPTTGHRIHTARGMTAIVVPRTSDNTMSGYNTHVELDEVHTPSRYFALLSYLLPGRPVVLFTAFSAFSCGVSSLVGFFCSGVSVCLPSRQQQFRHSNASVRLRLRRLRPKKGHLTNIRFEDY